MLLDTICNTFGGVVFIALLIVLLLRSTVQRLPEAHQDSPPVHEVRRVQAQLTELESELQAARQTQAEQARLTQLFAPEKVRELAGALRQRREEGQDLQQEVQAWTQQCEAAKKKLEELRTRLDDQEQETERIERELEVARAEREAMRQRLEELVHQRSRELKTPVVHSSGLKQSVGLIVRYSRLYVWHKYDRHGNRLGLNTDEFTVVGREKLPTGQSALITRPIPTRGVPLNDSPDSKVRVRQRLQQFDSDQHYLTVCLREDSFDSFRHLRDVIVALGFEYRLMLLEDDTAIVDRGGERSDVQ
ncbi:MAG: hypothetical protein GXP27_04645 [Planctomycetes bacterium]|nr:hypothetical protein [Planctomycetota bacterium]